MMHGHEKSRSAIVAVKPTNKVVRPAAEQSAVEPAAAEPVERRAEAVGTQANKARTGRSTGYAWHRRGLAYGKHLPS
jgi:hypothetical protein